MKYNVALKVIILFTFLQTYFLSNTIDTVDSQHCFGIESITIGRFGWSMWRNSATHKYLAGKGSSVLIAFLNNFGYFLKKILFIFREGKRGWKRESNIDACETHQLVASPTPATGNLAHNPDLCPDQELNQWPFSLRDDAQPIEPYQSGLCICDIITKFNK